MVEAIENINNQMFQDEYNLEVCDREALREISYE